MTTRGVNWRPGRLRLIAGFIAGALTPVASLAAYSGTQDFVFLELFLAVGTSVALTVLILFVLPIYFALQRFGQVKFVYLIILGGAASMIPYVVVFNGLILQAVLDDGSLARSVIREMRNSVFVTLAILFALGALGAIVFWTIAGRFEQSSRRPLS